MDVKLRGLTDMLFDAQAIQNYISETIAAATSGETTTYAGVSLSRSMMTEVFNAFLLMMMSPETIAVRYRLDPLDVATITTRLRADLATLPEPPSPSWASTRDAYLQRLADRTT